MGGCGCRAFLQEGFAEAHAEALEVDGEARHLRAEEAGARFFDDGDDGEVAGGGEAGFGQALVEADRHLLVGEEHGGGRGFSWSHRSPNA